MKIAERLKVGWGRGKEWFCIKYHRMIKGWNKLMSLLSVDKCCFRAGKGYGLSVSLVLRICFSVPKLASDISCILAVLYKGRGSKKVYT